MATADEISIWSYIVGVALLVNIVIALHLAIYRLGQIRDELVKANTPPSNVWIPPVSDATSTNIPLTGVATDKQFMRKKK